MLEIRVSLNKDEIQNPAELDNLHRRLLTSLQRSGLVRVRPVRSEETTDGARGIKEIFQGVFEATLLNTTTASIKAIARSLSEFIARSRRSIYVEIRGNKLRLDKASPEETEQILARYFAEITSDKEQ